MVSRAVWAEASAFAEPVLPALAEHPVSTMAPMASPAAAMRADLRNRACVMMGISFLVFAGEGEGVVGVAVQ
jgi:hypothetical protein